MILTLITVTFYLLSPLVAQTVIQITTIPNSIKRSVLKSLVVYLLGAFQTLTLEIIALLLLIAITNRPIIAASIFFLIFMLFNIINKILLVQRGMILLPIDLKMILNWRELSSMISKFTALSFLFIFSVFIFITFKLQTIAPAIQMSIPLRIISFLLCTIVLLSVFSLNHPKSLPYKIYRWKWMDHCYIFNQLLGAKFNGFVLQFLNNVDSKIMDTPSNYSKSTIDEIIKKYNQLASVINETRIPKPSSEKLTIVLSESFSNPNDLAGIETTKNVLPNFSSTCESACHLSMISGYVGGGTANIEYEVHTGFSNALFSASTTTPYSQVIPKMKRVNSIVDAFENAIGMHTYTGNLYQRDSVYSKLGIKPFFTTSNPTYRVTHTRKYDYGKYIDDYSFFKELLFHVKNSSDNSIITSISMQNHMPYYDRKVFGLANSNSHIPINLQAYDSYLYGITKTDKELGEFIRELNSHSEPVTLLFYGDHLPGIFSSISTTEKTAKYRKTPVLIWQNSAADERGAIKLPDTFNNSPLGSNTLLPATFAAKNWAVSGYFALLTEVMESLPAMVNEALPGKKLSFVDSTLSVFNESSLTAIQKEILNEYRLIQFDMTAGKQYAPIDFFNFPISN